MDEKIKLVNRQLIHDGTSIRVYSDVMEFGEGKKEIWDYVEHKFNASAVIPVLPNGNILLVQQLRSAVGRSTLEIPAGKRDNNGKENPFDCAKRELLEETGYTSDNIEHVATINPVPAYCSETVDLYIAHNIYKAGRQKLDDGEFINIEEYSLDKLQEMIKLGKIRDGKTLVATFYMLSINK